MAVTGQLWFTAEGDPTDARIAYINDDGTNQTVQVDNSPTTDLITGFVQEIGLDTAAGWYFAIVNGGNLGSGAHLVRGSIGTPGPVVDIVAADFIIGNDPGDSNFDDIIVNALQVDNINEKIYVTYQDPNGDATKTGIRQYSYDPITGAVTDQGFLVQASVDNTKPLNPEDLYSDILDVRDFELDLTSNTLYFTELLTGGIQEMGLYRMDLTSKVITQMVSSTQFPDAGTNGYIIDVEVDPTTDLVYFTTESTSPFGSAGYNAAHNAIWFVAQGATNATATQLTLTGLPGGAHLYPGDMVFDQNKRQIYVESEEGNAGSTDDVIFVFQLNAAGTSASLVSTINQTPEFTNSGANFGGMAFDILAEVATLNPTAVHAVEQVTALDLLLAAPTISDTDGDHLNNATVTISGSFVGSGDDLYVLDGAAHKTTGTFTGIPGITISRTTDGSGNQQLKLTGYGTFAEYQTILNAVAFTANGDNPTNYGASTSRTVTWQVNDGAAGNPSGTVNGTDTNVRTSTINIDAVNDAPVNNLPGSASVNEDVQTAITGISITDVDADPANQDITVTFSVVHGTLNVLTAVAGGIQPADLISGQNTNTVVITATQNQINATIAGNGLRYTSDLNFNSGFATETLHIVTSDNGHTDSPAFPGAQGDTDNLIITVNAVNDNPNLQPDTTSPVGYIENAAPTALFSGENVDTPLGDVDQSANYLGGSIDLNITAGFVTGDRISLTGARFVIVSNNIQDTANGNAVVGTIGATNATSHVTVSALTAAATPSVVDALIKAFGFDSTSDNPGAGDRTVTLTFNDGGNTGSGGAKTDAVTQTVNVTPVNDAPVSTITPTTYSATEQVNLVLKNNGLAVSDVDGNSGVETITLSVTEGTLTVTVGNSGVTVDSGNGTSSVVVSGTLTQLNALLGAGGTSNLVYNDNTDTPAASATLTLLIHDNGSSGTGGDLSANDTATINITAVNDTPNAFMATDPYAATENVALNIKNTGMSVSDVDSLGGIEVATLSVTQGILNISAGTSGVTVGGDGTGSVTLTGTLAQINALLNTDGGSTVSYTETNDNPAATVTLTLQINDQGNTGTGGALIGTDTSTINITAANDAPVATITPTSYSATEQVNLSLKNNGLAVSDVDGNSGNETVTLSVTEGTITIGVGTSGVIIDSGNGTSSVTFHGSLTQLNDLLNTNATSTISYIDNTDTPAASATLTLLIHDNGNTGTGGDLSANDTATINITATNDTPNALMTTDPYVATEQTTLVLKGTGMSVSDVDSLGGVETITLSVGEGALTVTEGDSGVTVVSGNGTSSVQVSGTLAQLNALLAAGGTSNLTYVDNSDNPAASTTLTLQVNDQGNTGTGGPLIGTDTSAINITAVNDAPAAIITPTSYAGSPGVSFNLKNNGLAVSDVDGNNGSETVTLSVTSGTLTVTTGGSGAGVAGSGTSSVTITGTIAQINALLNTDGTSTVSFLDGAGGSKTLTLLIHDNGNTGGVDLSASDTATINLDQPPVLSDAGNTVGYTEQAAAIFVDGSPSPFPTGITVSDPDAPPSGNAINSATVTITGAVAGDFLDASNIGVAGISISWNGTDTLTLSGPDTMADYQAVLRSVVFSSTSDDPTNGGANNSRTITWVVKDIFDVPSAPVTTTINVTAVNDGPVSVITPTSFSATEQTALDLKAQGLSVSDPDANTNSVTVTLSVTEGTLNVTTGGSGAGVAGSGTSAVTLTGTLAQINALLTTDATSTVSYIDGTDNPSASATLTLAINDNGNTGGGVLNAQDTATINITAVNDAPTATITPPTYNATENITLNLKTNGLSVSDASDGNLGSMTVTLSVTEGTLNVQAGSSGAIVSGSPGASVTITGTVAQINALLNTDGTSVVQYTETDDTPSAAVTLTLAINDNGNTGGGPGLTAQDTATINITATNDLPVVGNLTPSITYLAATPPQTLSSGTTVTDPDSANLTSASVTLTDHQAGDELSVNGAVVGGPVNGISWSYNAGTGVLSFIGPSSLANYQALLDTVQYRSTSGDPSNGGTTNTRDVAWVVNDGTDPSVTQHTSISLGNQAPVVDLNGGGGGTNADQPFTEGLGAVGVASASMSIADPDDANLTSATIVLTNAKAGDSLAISGALPGGISSIITSGAGTITVTLSGSASKANYTTAIQQVVFNNSSDNPDLTDRQITVTVNDGQDNSNSAITTVHVGGVNDGPTNTVPATQNIEANTSTAIGGLAVTDLDSAGAAITTTLSVGHGTLTVASAGGAAVSGSGTGSVTLTGSVAAINTTLAAANNVVYKGALDFFGTDTLTVLTNDLGNTGTGGPLSDTDNVTLNINTLITGTPGNDSYNALPGQERIDALGGIDTVTFNFKLVDASVKYSGNKVIIDGPTGSHTVLTGFEVFKFTDGTVHNDDGSPLIDDLFYYSKYHDVWNAHVDADAHYNSVGWHENRDPDAFFSTVVYLSSNPDVKASGVNPLSHFDLNGWKEGRVPSITFDPAQYLNANADVKAANIDPLRHYLANGYQEGRQPFAPSELIGATGFDYVYYLNHNPDVAASGVDPFQHFQTVGWHEGRNPNALFDVNGYLATYTDVHTNPLDHYNQFGWHEGRDPSVGFDTTSYLGAYADVNAAHINPLTHFLHYGIHEGRSPFADGVWG